MKTKDVIIAFDPPAKVAKSAIEISKEIAKSNEVHFVLDGVIAYPHITCYSIRCPQENIEQIINALKELKQSFSSFRVEFVSFFFNDRGYLGLDLKKSKEIKDLHTAVVEKINSFREGLTKEKYASSLELNSEQQKNVQKYGHPKILNLYKPHLTLTRLVNDKEAKKVTSSINWGIPNFEIDTISLYEYASSGTCTNPIATVRL